MYSISKLDLAFSVKFDHSSQYLLVILENIDSTCIHFQHLSVCWCNYCNMIQTATQYHSKHNHYNKHF